MIRASNIRLPGVYFLPSPRPRGGGLPPLDVAAFVGFAERGPLDWPVAVEDLDTYRAIFGGDLALARESGGRVLLPSTYGEIVSLSEGVARDIGAQYVVTYAPLRPFAGGAVGERRRCEVSARKQGLRLSTTRGVVTAPPRP